MESTFYLPMNILNEWVLYNIFFNSKFHAQSNIICKRAYACVSMSICQIYFHIFKYMYAHIWARSPLSKHSSCKYPISFQAKRKIYKNSRFIKFCSYLFFWSVFFFLFFGFAVDKIFEWNSIRASNVSSSASKWIYLIRSFAHVCVYVYFWQIQLYLGFPFSIH